MVKSTLSIRTDFKKRLTDKRIIVAPGVFDALSARIAENVGFEAVFLSGSAVAFSQLGRPDIGLVTMPELVDAVGRISDCVSIPIIADVDSAFGAAPHAARLMRQFEKAGASAVQVEDQQVVKPANALLSRPLVNVEDMKGKIRAMADARHCEEMLISARTDEKDPSKAIDRCVAYHEAGADIVFAEGMTKAADLKRLIAAVGEQTPVVYNTSYPNADAASAVELEALGVRVALFPGLAVQSAAAGMISHLRTLKQEPSLTGGAKSPLSAANLLDLLEANQFLSNYK